jgi:carboxypeptidase family protein
MTLKRFGIAAVLALVWIVSTPRTGLAQSAIVGMVKDTSGAVLPGVTVEASSDVLIEKTRAVTTDGSGQYKIVDLRPGQYVVTFSLPGFATIKRENVDLPANFTTAINAEMKVGSLEESITVSATSPVVDVTTAAHAQVLNREAIDAIPTGRTIQGMGQLVVGVSLNLPDTGGARAMQQTYMSTHGMTSANNTIMVDGMIVNGLQADGSVQSYFNDAMNQEVAYQTSGIGAETSAGGVRLNLIPREGGNKFTGDLKSAFRPHQWQGDNVGSRLQSLGVKPNSGNGIDRIIDATVSEGGPIKQDKLWFFGSGRYFSVNNFIANTVQDDGSRGVDDQFIRSAMLRITWQVTPKLKFGAYHDEIDKYRGHDMQSLYDPETAATVWNSPAYHTNQAKLTYTATSRLLVEGGFSSNLEYYTNSYRPGIEQPRGSVAWYENTGQSEANLGGLTRATTGQTTQSPARFNWQGSASYVTGTHNIKIGGQYQRGTFFHTVDANGDLYQVYRSSNTIPCAANGKTGPYSCPDSVVIRNTPLAQYGERLNYDVGIYAQDTFTLNRLSVTGGLRYEWLNAQVEPADSPAGRWAPARHFDAVKNLPNWHDPAPRFSAVYDLLGNSKTALKYSVNRYNQARTTGIAGNYNPLASRTATLQWRDVNGDDIAQGERGCNYGTSGLPGCEINSTALSPSFGNVSLNTYGAYPRTWNIEHAVEVQHELVPRLSLTASWFHGSFHNLTTTINTSLQASGDPLKNPNYTPFTVYNPLTGEAITVYGRTPAASSLVTNLDTFDPNEQRIYNAYNLEFRARPGRGAQIFGGLALERQRDVNCTSPDNPNNVRFCDDVQNDIPFSRQFKLAGSYPLPYGVQFSASFQSNQSPAGSSATTTEYLAITKGVTRYPANCAAPCPAGQVILPASFIGSPTAPSSLNVPLIPWHAFFLDRINQLDFKVQKSFKVNRFTVLPTFEMFNVNNSDAIISTVTNNLLSGSNGFANSVMQPRMIGVGAQVRW